MTSGYWSAPCDCQACTVANTPRVTFEGGTSLHVVEAAKYLASRQRVMTSLAEIAERLRNELGLTAQRGDE